MPPKMKRPAASASTARMPRPAAAASISPVRIRPAAASSPPPSPPASPTSPVRSRPASAASPSPLPPASPTSPAAWSDQATRKRPAAADAADGAALPAAEDLTAGTRVIAAAKRSRSKSPGEVRSSGNGWYRVHLDNDPRNKTKAYRRSDLQLVDAPAGRAPQSPDMGPPAPGSPPLAPPTLVPPAGLAQPTSPRTRRVATGARRSGATSSGGAAAERGAIDGSTGGTSGADAGGDRREQDVAGETRPAIPNNLAFMPHYTSGEDPLPDMRDWRRSLNVVAAKLPVLEESVPAAPMRPEAPPEATDPRTPTDPAEPPSHERTPTEPASPTAPDVRRPQERLPLGRPGPRGRTQKTIRPAIRGITKPDLRRLARRGGVKRIAGGIYNEARGAMHEFVEKTVSDAIEYTFAAQRTTVSAQDIILALRRHKMVLMADLSKRRHVLC
mmetsp:Transcript_10911/g.20515  ORF Transcript_10911/g.20515 Transcript_10911/m.20515 type:complete len:443 (-) Transcript_10911:61-1389(-)